MYALRKSKTGIFEIHAKARGEVQNKIQKI